MKKKACFPKEELKRGAWSKQEDRLLSDYILAHGHGKWRTLPVKAGLNRCGKSCRMRWLNYLKPGVKRGNITEEEEELIIRMHKLLGNRWSLIAGRIPGRTDNEIKNYWNTYIKKNIATDISVRSSTTQPSFKSISAKKADKMKNEGSATSSLKFKEFHHQIDNTNNYIIHDENLLLPLGWDSPLKYNGRQEASPVAPLDFGEDTEFNIGELYHSSLLIGNEWREANTVKGSEKLDTYISEVEWKL